MNSFNRSTYDSDNRQAVYVVSWSHFHGLCRSLARALADDPPEVVLAIGRGGFFPATLIAQMLQIDMWPLLLSRRVRDVVLYDTPRWKVRPPREIKGQDVLVFDEISRTGTTMRMVLSEVQKLGARRARGAVLYATSDGAEAPHYIGVQTDQLILNPWDREVLTEGNFVLHPEVIGDLYARGVHPAKDLMIDAAEIEIAKGAPSRRDDTRA